jgi:hypothetical protein
VITGAAAGAGFFRVLREAYRELRHDADALLIYLSVCDRAAYKPTSARVRGGVVMLARFEAIISTREIEQTEQIDRSRVRRALARLERLAFVVVSTRPVERPAIRPGRRPETDPRSGPDAGPVVTVVRVCGLEVYDRGSQEFDPRSGPETDRKPARGAFETDPEEERRGDFESSAPNGAERPRRRLELVTTPKVDRRRRAPRRVPRSAMCSDWQPTAETVAEMRTECPSVDVLGAVAEFRDWWISEGGVKADWDSTFRNRVRELAKRVRSEGSSDARQPAPGNPAARKPPVSYARYEPPGSAPVAPDAVTRDDVAEISWQLRTGWSRTDLAEETARAWVAYCTQHAAQNGEMLSGAMPLWEFAAAGPGKATA